MRVPRPASGDDIGIVDQPDTRGWGSQPDTAPTSSATGSSPSGCS